MLHQANKTKQWKIDIIKTFYSEKIATYVQHAIIISNYNTLNYFKT